MVELWVSDLVAALQTRPEALFALITNAGGILVALMALRVLTMELRALRVAVDRLTAALPRDEYTPVSMTRPGVRPGARVAS